MIKEISRSLSARLLGIFILTAIVYAVVGRFVYLLVLDQDFLREVVGAHISLHADYVLKFDVRTFEARYDHGQVAMPTIMVEVHAALDRTQDRTVVGDRSFKAAVTASDNRVGAIAAAFDQAVAKVLGELVAWVNARGEG